MKKYSADNIEHPSLDLDDESHLRSLGHQIWDEMLDQLTHLREEPVWQPIPASARDPLKSPSPHRPEPLETLYALFKETILPYSVGNRHPGFFGWVHGAGTPHGALAELLAAGLNTNLGGRDQMPIEVERQLLGWAREWFDFPATAGGLFVTGTSMANLMAVWIARRVALGEAVRHAGLATTGGGQLRAYTSTGAHGCIDRAMDLAGLGTANLVKVPTDSQFKIDLSALRRAIALDRSNGLRPFMVIATAGTVDTGAIDDLAAVADLCREEALWFHVDGAFGALARWSPALAPRLTGIERADSIAFDFHKWGQVPYDAGYLLVRDQEHQIQTFAAPAAYLRREARGTAAGAPWPCDLGPDLSRGFRAFKTWWTLKTHGTERLGKIIEQTCQLARWLENRISDEPELELLAPVTLSIVCFRYRSVTGDIDHLNARIAIALQESGLAVLSTTLLGESLALRVAIVNHRTRVEDLEILLQGVLHLGHRFTLSQPPGSP